MATAKKQRKSKDEAEQQLAKELPMTSGSDPLASSQPGGGITGPEVKPLEPPLQEKSARR